MLPLQFRRDLPNETKHIKRPARQILLPIRSRAIIHRPQRIVPDLLLRRRGLEYRVEEVRVRARSIPGRVGGRRCGGAVAVGPAAGHGDGGGGLVDAVYTEADTIGARRFGLVTSYFSGATGQTACSASRARSASSPGSGGLEGSATYLQWYLRERYLHSWVICWIVAGIISWRELELRREGLPAMNHPLRGSYLCG